MSKLSASSAPRRAVAMILSFWLSCWSTVALADEELEDPDAGASVQNLDSESNAPPWPLQFTQNGRTFQIYQPQVDRWENNRLEGRAAVAVSDQTGAPPRFGVVHVAARTDLDPGQSRGDGTRCGDHQSRFSRRECRRG